MRIPGCDYLAGGDVVRYRKLLSSTEYEDPQGKVQRHNFWVFRDPNTRKVLGYVYVRISKAEEPGRYAVDIAEIAVDETVERDKVGIALCAKSLSEIKRELNGVVSAVRWDAINEESKGLAEKFGFNAVMYTRNDGRPGWQCTLYPLQVSPVAGQAQILPATASVSPQGPSHFQAELKTDNAHYAQAPVIAGKQYGQKEASKLVDVLTAQAEEGARTVEYEGQSYSVVRDRKEFGSKPVFIHEALRAQIASLYGFSLDNCDAKFIDILIDLMKLRGVMLDDTTARGFVFCQLNKSQSLFENHTQDGFIGVNEALFTQVASGHSEKTRILKALLETGLTHELMHESGQQDESWLTQQDAALFVYQQDVIFWREGIQTVITELQQICSESYFADALKARMVIFNDPQINTAIAAITENSDISPIFTAACRAMNLRGDVTLGEVRRLLSGLSNQFLTPENIGLLFDGQEAGSRLKDEYFDLVNEMMLVVEDLTETASDAMLARPPTDLLSYGSKIIEEERARRVSAYKALEVQIKMRPLEDLIARVDRGTIHGVKPADLWRWRKQNKWYTLEEAQGRVFLGDVAAVELWIKKLPAQQASQLEVRTLVELIEKVKGLEERLAKVESGLDKHYVMWGNYEGLPEIISSCEGVLVSARALGVLGVAERAEAVLEVFSARRRMFSDPDMIASLDILQRLRDQDNLTLDQIAAAHQTISRARSTAQRMRDGLSIKARPYAKTFFDILLEKEFFSSVDQNLTAREPQARRVLELEALTVKESARDALRPRYLAVGQESEVLCDGENPVTLMLGLGTMIEVGRDSFGFFAVRLGPDRAELGRRVYFQDDLAIGSNERNNLRIGEIVSTAGVDPAVARRHLHIKVTGDNQIKLIAEAGFNYLSFEGEMVMPLYDAGDVLRIARAMEHLFEPLDYGSERARENIDKLTFGRTKSHILTLLYGAEADKQNSGDYLYKFFRRYGIIFVYRKDSILLGSVEGYISAKYLHFDRVLMVDPIYQKGRENAGGFYSYDIGSITEGYVILDHIEGYASPEDAKIISVHEANHGFDLAETWVRSLGNFTPADLEYSAYLAQLLVSDDREVERAYEEIMKTAHKAMQSEAFSDDRLPDDPNAAGQCRIAREFFNRQHYDDCAVTTIRSVAKEAREAFYMERFGYVPAYPDVWERPIEALPRRTSSVSSGRGFSDLSNELYTPLIQEAIQSNNFSAVNYENGFDHTSLRMDDGTLKEGKRKLTAEQFNNLAGVISSEDFALLQAWGLTLIFIQGLDESLKQYYVQRGLDPPLNCYGSHYGLSRNQIYLDLSRLDSVQELRQHLHHEIQERAAVLDEFPDGIPTVRTVDVNSIIQQAATRAHVQLEGGLGASGAASESQLGAAVQEGGAALAKLLGEREVRQAREAAAAAIAAQGQGETTKILALLSLLENIRDPSYREYAEKVFAGHPFNAVEIAWGSETKNKKIREVLMLLSPLIPAEHARQLKRIYLISESFVMSGFTIPYLKHALFLSADDKLDDESLVETMSSLAHEIGHLVTFSGNIRKSWISEIRPSSRYIWQFHVFHYLIFYEISTIMLNVFLVPFPYSLLTALSSILVFLPAVHAIKIGQDPLTLVSRYALTNSAEDFADTYRYFVIDQPGFARETSRNPLLQPRYTAMNRIFGTREVFDTGILRPEKISTDGGASVSGPVNLGPGASSIIEPWVKQIEEARQEISKKNISEAISLLQSAIERLRTIQSTSVYYEAAQASIIEAEEMLGRIQQAGTAPSSGVKASDWLSKLIRSFAGSVLSLNNIFKEVKASSGIMSFTLPEDNWYSPIRTKEDSGRELFKVPASGFALVNSKDHPNALLFTLGLIVCTGVAVKAVSVNGDVYYGLGHVFHGDANPDANTSLLSEEIKYIHKNLEDVAKSKGIEFKNIEFIISYIPVFYNVPDTKTAKEQFEADVAKTIKGLDKVSAIQLNARPNSSMKAHMVTEEGRAAVIPAADSAETVFLPWGQGLASEPQEQGLQGIDRRPVSAGLLNAPIVSYCMETKQIVNQRSERKVAIYGGAGVDVSTFLLSTDARSAYFVDRIYGGRIEAADLGLLSEYRDKANANYAQKKYLRGYSEFDLFYTEGRDLKSGLLGALALELQAVGVDLSTVKVSDDEGYPRITFQWAFVGQSVQEYSITFISADIETPAEEYPKKLQKILQGGIDIYYQRAAFGLARKYSDENSYIFPLYEAMRTGGYFVTDDYAAGETDPISFPIPLAETPVPHFVELSEEIIEGLKDYWAALHYKHIQGYGWHLRIRQKLAEEKLSPSRADSIDQGSSAATANKGGIDFRSLPIVTQPVTSRQLPVISRQSPVNIDKEWLQIEKMLQVGIRPSANRIKAYAYNCAISTNSQDIDKVLSCIADILRQEEETCCETEESLRQMLVLLESDQPYTKLPGLINSITVTPKEPKIKP
ncbi:MAG: hypothetical protein WCY12_02720 [Candidatus Omnitrophota bacterium]